jgi:hypothetical protein
MISGLSSVSVDPVSTSMRAGVLDPRPQTSAWTKIRSRSDSYGLEIFIVPAAVDMLRVKRADPAVRIAHTASAVHSFNVAPKPTTRAAATYGASNVISTIHTHCRGYRAAISRPDSISEMKYGAAAEVAIGQFFRDRVQGQVS